MIDERKGRRKKEKMRNFKKMGSKIAEKKKTGPEVFCTVHVEKTREGKKKRRQKKENKEGTGASSVCIYLLNRETYNPEIIKVGVSPSGSATPNAR